MKLFRMTHLLEIAARTLKQDINIVILSLSIFFQLKARNSKHRDLLQNPKIIEVAVSFNCLLGVVSVSTLLIVTASVMSQKIIEGPSNACGLSMTVALQ